MSTPWPSITRAEDGARRSRPAAPRSFLGCFATCSGGELPVLGVWHPAAQRAVDGPDIRPGAGCGDVAEWLANEGGFGGGEWPGHQARAVVLTCVAAVAPPGSPSACGAASRVIRDDRQLHWHDAEMANDEVLTLLGAALADLEADGVAMGVVVGDQVEFSSTAGDTVMNELIVTPSSTAPRSRNRSWEYCSPA